MTPRLSPRELDRRVVPVAAARLRSLLDAGARSRERLRAAARGRMDDAGAAGHRVDERVLGHGPLQRLRAATQLALPVVAAVLLAGVVAAVRLDDSPPTAAPAPAGPRVVQLGVPQGTDVDAHLVVARRELEELSLRLPRTRLLAVVHFDRYLSAAEVMPLLEGADVQRVYLRASTAGPDAELLEALSENAPADLPALCTATAARKAQETAGLQAIVAKIPPDAADQQELRKTLEEQAVRLSAEAEAFGGECVTGFAALVQAPVDVLRQVEHRDGVRGVEAAPSGTSPADLDVEPLLPELTGVVPTVEK